MLVGLLSDTHDRLDALRRAVNVLVAHGAEHLVHAGDWSSPLAVEAMVELGVPFTGVLGNVERDREASARVSPHVHASPHGLRLGGRQLLVVHNLKGLGSGGQGGADVVVCGHTHRASIGRSGRLVVNPGECSGARTGVATAALLDLDTLDASILEL